MGLAITTRPTQTHAAPTELGLAFVGRRGYRHGAPNGAFPPVASTDVYKEHSGLPHAKTLRVFWHIGERASVMDCASPLALWHRDVQAI